MTILKIISLAIAAIGSGIALLGDPREDGRLNRLGRISLGLVFIGLVVVISIEIITAITSRTERELSLQWSTAQEQSIYQVGLTAYQVDEVLVEDFVSNLNRINIIIGTFTFLENDKPATRCFCLRRSGESTDLERAIQLSAVSTTNQLVGGGLGINLKKREWTDPLGRQGRIYSSSIDDDWTNPEAKTCGVEAKIEWYKLGFGDNIKSIGQIPKIKTMTISFPSKMDLSRFDRLDLAFITADYQVFFVDLLSLDYHRVHGSEGESLVADIEGFEILQSFEKSFREQGGRGAIGVSFGG